MYNYIEPMFRMFLHDRREESVLMRSKNQDRQRSILISAAVCLFHHCFLVYGLQSMLAHPSEKKKNKE